MNRLKDVLCILIDSPDYFNRPLKLRLEHAKEILEREEVIKVSRTGKDLTESAKADQELYREATGQPAVKRYTAKKHGRLTPYSRSQRRANKRVQLLDDED